MHRFHTEPTFHLQCCLSLCLDFYVHQIFYDISRIFRWVPVVDFADLCLMIHLEDISKAQKMTLFSTLEFCNSFQMSWAELSDLTRNDHKTMVVAIPADFVE